MEHAVATMKYHFRWLTFILFASIVHADDEIAIAGLHPGLVPIYESLIADGSSTALIGKSLELTFKLKFASEKYLLFWDTQITVDNQTKYYLIKWKFDPGDIEGILGMSNVECTIQGKIIEVVKGSTSPNMPYVIVEVESVELKR